MNPIPPSHSSRSDSLASHPPAWWNGARAALARAFAHVHVRRCELQELNAADGTAADALVWPSPVCEVPAGDCRISADTRTWQPPAAQGGGGGLDGAALPCAVSSNSAPGLPDDAVHWLPTALSPARVHSAGAEQFLEPTTRVQPLAVGLTGGGAFALPTAVRAPGVWAASVALHGAQRGGRRRDERGVLLFRAPRLGSDLGRLTRVPVPRRRATLPADADTATAFAAERQALAAACGAGVEDVKLLAAFPGVPLRLVQHMAATPDGETLHLWLRAEALAAGAGWTAARVTIVLGRRRSTGEAVRAVLAEGRAAGRKP